MKQWFVKTAIAVLAILLAELFSAWCLKEFTTRFEHHYSPYKATAIAMAAAVLFFYPVLEFSQKYIKAISEAYIKGTKKASGGKFWVVIAGVLLALFLLFAGFAKLRYNKNVFKDFKREVTKIF